MRSSATACFLVLHAITLAAADRYTFTHLAGTAGGIGYRDAKASDARFYEPTGLGVDAQGNIFVSDYGNHVIRKITPQGEVTTLAGLARQMGFQDGRGSSARFHCPYSPAIDSNGDIFLSDSDNHVIRKITARGDVVTIAGNGSVGSENGSGTSARFDEPYGLALDPLGNIIVADSDNHTIRRVTPAGVVTTIAGSPGNAGFADGAGGDARFHHPTDVAVAADSTIYVADEDNTAIRRIDSGGAVTTIAGSPGATIFDHPLSIAIDVSGILYVADFGGQTIRRIALDRTVTTLAGSAGTPGASDGRGAAARFHGPTSVRLMPSGSLIVADSFNDELRVVALDGSVSTLAGLAAEAGYADGVGAAARFDQPDGVAASSAGRIAVSDSGNHVIRALTFDGSVSVLAGSPGSPGFADGVNGTARFNSPAQLSSGAAGEFYVADFANAAVRSIAASGLVSTLAGAGLFLFPTSASRGPRSGAVYVADRNNHVIRRIENGQVTTLAGTVGVAGASDGPAPFATFNLPHSIVSDADENLYVADYGNHTVRKISNVGVVTTIAGSPGKEGHADGDGSEARFDFPSSVAIDSDGSLFVTDSVSHTIRRISAGGHVTTLGGIAGAPGSGDGTAAHAQFNAPYAIAVTADVLLVADRNNHAIRIGKVAAPDRAAIDASVGAVGMARALTVESQSGTSFHWTLIRKPSASSAEIEDADASEAHFTPDVPDLFEFELTAEGPQGLSITTVTLTAFDKTRRRAAR